MTDIIDVIQNSLRLVLLVSVIVLLGLLVFSLHSLLIYFKSKYTNLNSGDHSHIDNANKETTEYSNNLLEFIRLMVGQTAVIEFQTFQDNHDMTKVTKANIESVAKRVAEIVHNSINEDVFSFENVFFTRRFYDYYIVNTSIVLVKQMFEKVVDNYEFY